MRISRSLYRRNVSPGTDHLRLKNDTLPHAWKENIIFFCNQLITQPGILRKWKYGNGKEYFSFENFFPTFHFYTFNSEIIFHNIFILFFFLILIKLAILDRVFLKIIQFFFLYENNSKVILKIWWEEEDRKVEATFSLVNPSPRSADPVKVPHDLTLRAKNFPFTGYLLRRSCVHAKFHFVNGLD